MKKQLLLIIIITITLSFFLSETALAWHVRYLGPPIKKCDGTSDYKNSKFKCAQPHWIIVCSGSASNRNAQSCIRPILK